MNQIPLARRIRAGLDIVAGLTIVAAFIVLLTDQVQTGSFEPGKHFAYLTNQTSYSNIVVLLAGGFLALSRQADTVLYTTVRANFVAYAFVVGVVYNALLRGPDDFGFHNEVTHVVIPVYLVTDWVMRSARPRIGWKTVWIGISYPVVWVGVTLLRAPSVEWYPLLFPRSHGTPTGLGRSGRLCPRDHRGVRGTHFRAGRPQSRPGAQERKTFRLFPRRPRFLIWRSSP